MPARGRVLFRRGWLPERAERALVILHGFGEHSGRYEDTATWLAQRRCAVHAYDQQGHGATPGRRGHIASFASVLDDLEAFLADVAAAHSDVPLILVGHSWGGLVAAALACERDPDIDLLVTSGAALSLSPDLSRIKILLARLLCRSLPRLSMDAGIDARGLSRDAAVIRRYEEDPLVQGRATARFAAEAIAATTRTSAAPQAVRVPVLLLHGADDPLCLCAGSEAFYAGLPRDIVPGSELRTYPKLLHEIFNEPEREQVWSDLLAWVRQHERRGRS